MTASSFSQGRAHNDNSEYADINLVVRYCAVANEISPALFTARYPVRVTWQEVMDIAHSTSSCNQQDGALMQNLADTLKRKCAEQIKELESQLEFDSLVGYSIDQDDFRVILSHI